MDVRHPNEVASVSRGRFLRAGWACALMATWVRPAVAHDGGQVVAWAEDWIGFFGLLLVLCVTLAWSRERRMRVRAEDRLTSANERLRVLFDESPLSICLFDPHDRKVPYRIVECNQYACDLHGLARGEMIGRSLGALMPMEITYEDAQALLKLLREGTVRGEAPHKRKDGSVFFIEYVSRLVVIEGREFVLGADRDLTAERERRASEEQLRETAELNQLVLKASNDGVWDWHVGQKHIAYSDRCREMLGYGPDELPDGDPVWLDMLHAEDRDVRVELLRRHWEEGAPYVFQFRAKHKDGNWRWIISRGITLFDAEHRPVRMVGCRTDITELKRIDAELLQSRKLRAVGELVGGIAHEFNNLLTPMLLHAEMLGMGHERDPRVASHLGPIRVGIDRARELTQRILTFGRRSTDGRELLDLEELVRENLEFLAQTIERRIRIEVHSPASRACVCANRSDMNQLVMNLVLNARDTLMEKESTSPHGGWTPRLDLSITSVTRASGARDEGDRHTPREWHRLTVQDNGLGMSDEVRERVFEPFFTTKEVGRGTGLGLATAWHVSTAVGGWIEIDSRPGEGTAFHVFLPKATGEPASMPVIEPSTRERSPFAREVAAPQPTAPGPRRRVLLVEDNDIVSFATQQLIASFGHEVTCVNDGRAAWEQVKQNPRAYDVVFSDLNLPGVDGVELVRLLRESAFPGTIVVYSGYFSSLHQAQLEALKVDHLLPKPFIRAQLEPILG